MGILTGHAYSIIGARELLVNGQPEYLLQIRNPWGQKEWTGMQNFKGELKLTGRWSDNSREWTKEICQQLGHKRDANDGTNTC